MSTWLYPTITLLCIGTGSPWTLKEFLSSISDITENGESIYPISLRSDLHLSEYNGSLVEKVFSFFPDLKKLSISESTIQGVNPESFQMLPKLKEMSISSSSLPPMKNAWFKNVKKLDRLSVFSNKGVVEGDVFSNLTKLKDLQVYSQELPMKLENRLLKGSIKLKTLWLTLCKIKEIDQDAFKGLNHLEIVNLSGNEISFVPKGTFANKRLKGVYMSSNKITKIAGDEIYRLPKLKVLHLSYNPIARFNLAKIEQNAPALERLFLAYTEIPCKEKLEIKKNGNLTYFILFSSQEMELCENPNCSDCSEEE